MSTRQIATREHLPPTYYETGDEPGIFFAGPIQGAPDWQAQALEIIDAVPKSDSLHIFNPRARSVTSYSYEDQVAWEKHYLERARDYGAVLFWLAAQDYSLPYESGRAYAQTTRIEFGRAMGWLDYEPTLNIVIGIDSDYRGGSERYIRTCAEEFQLEVYSRLEDTCKAAARLALL